MVVDDINSHQCRFCNLSFSDDIIKKIKDDREDVYCENCGDLINRVNSKYNLNPLDIAKNEPKTKTNIKVRLHKHRKELKPN